MITSHPPRVARPRVIVADRATPRRAPRFGRSLAAVALLGVAARVLYLQVAGVPYGLDSTWYLLESAFVAHGLGYIDPTAYFQHAHVVATAAWPPGWPAFLAAVGVLTHGETAWRFGVTGALLGGVTVALTGVLGRRLVSPTVGLVAAAVVACSPHLIASDVSLMSETLTVPLALTFLLAFDRAVAGGASRRILAGVVLGVATLVRVDAVVLAAMVVAVLLLSRRDGRRRVLTAAAVTAATASLLVAPWMLRNEVRLGTPTLSTASAATAIAGANCPSTYGGRLLGSWDFACTRDDDRTTLGERRWSTELLDGSARYARANAGRVPLVLGARVLRVWGLWSPVQQAQLEAVESRHEPWQLLAWLVAAPLLVLAGVRLLRARRHAVPVLLVAPLLAVTAIALVTHGNERFRLPAEPIVAILAVDAARRLVSRAGRRTSRAATG